jgi:Domain of unknown function (DUF4287)
MSVHHSEETHRNLVERVPQITGRAMPEWFHAIDAGPSFARFDERANWLTDEHAIPHGYATAIVREYDKHRVNHGDI